MNENINDIKTSNIEPPSDRSSPPYTRREWYQIGFRDGYEKALEDVINKIMSENCTHKTKN